MDEMTLTEKHEVADKAHELDGRPKSKTVAEYVWWVGPTVDALKALGYTVTKVGRGSTSPA